MPKRTAMRTGPWTPDEFRTMWKLKNQGLTNRVISLKVRRSVSAISHQIRISHDYMSR